MKLKYIDHELDKNKKLSLSETKEKISYHEENGFFGRNGVGKTRALRTVYNTLEKCCDKDTPLEYINKFLEYDNDRGINFSKVIYLDINKILNIKQDNSDDLYLKNSLTYEFDIEKIDQKGLENYLIDNGINILLQYNSKKTSDEKYEIFQYLEYYLGMLVEDHFSIEVETSKNNERSIKLCYDGYSFLDGYDLSDGQWILIFFCLLLSFASAYNYFDDCVLIIDEVENHLNDDVIDMLCTKLKKVFSKNGQIWYASHSETVLSHLGVSCSYRIEKNKNRNSTIYCPSSLNYTLIRKSLAGQDVIEKYIDEFFTEFFSYCFIPSKIVQKSKKSDPQANLFLKNLQSYDSVRILDFGAGYGRVAEILNTVNNESKNRKNIEYYAYEINQKCYSELISKKEKGIIQDFYNEKGNIHNKFDIILLCNVLHEIDVLYWNDELNFMIDHLEQNGRIILLEDLKLPVGEHNFDAGFLLLSQNEISNLFGKENVEYLIHDSQKYKSRLLCAAISKQSNIDCNSIIDTIQLLRENSYKKVLNIRRILTLNDQGIQKLEIHKIGELISDMARQSQLFCNSEIALKYLKALDWKEYDGFSKFVESWKNGIIFSETNKILDCKNLENIINNILNNYFFEKEIWMENGNTLLTGGLYEKINIRLKSVKIFMSSEGFADLVTTYSNHRIFDVTNKKEYFNLVSEVVSAEILTL